MGRHRDGHLTSQFAMGLVLQVTYLSPRPEKALGKVPIEQPPWLKGPGPGPLAHRRLCSTMLPLPSGAMASVPS